MNFTTSVMYFILLTKKWDPPLLYKISASTIKKSAVVISQPLV